MNWKQRKAWIIGASSGIGEALADELEAKGCQVVRSARSGGDILIDVADDKSVTDAARTYQDKYGDFDLVVVMAGYWKRMTAKPFPVLSSSGLYNLSSVPEETELIFSTSFTSLAVREPSLDCFLRSEKDIRFLRINWIWLLERLHSMLNRKGCQAHKFIYFLSKMLCNFQKTESVSAKRDFDIRLYFVRKNAPLL